jgi:hypothetical protein
MEFMGELVPNIINGAYSDWVFNVFLTKVTLAVKNNLALLLLIAVSWKKVANLTKTQWDDKVAGWLVGKLTGVKSKMEGTKNEKTI